MSPIKKPAEHQEISETKKKANNPSIEKTAEMGASTPSKTRFQIVGIGTSAGGLEALELFFTNVPAKSGMAFIVVQHLDPTYKGMLVELLQRGTPLKVFQAKDSMRVAPNCVYVIPPNKDLSIRHGVLHLSTPLAPRGLRLPIDFFFRTLAEEQKEHSLGVILSGMGSDGTLGLLAIKEQGGTVFVQSPETAKFDGMPQSAIDAGLTDFIVPVQDLYASISAFIHHTPVFTQNKIITESEPQSLVEERANSSLENVILLMRSQTGHDFALYKKTTLYRRIERRISIYHMENIAEYVRFLQDNPQEVKTLFNELLIGVTSFFRDPAAWEELKTEALPSLLAGCPPGKTLRAWVPGCSTGEEAYSLAISFTEALDALRPQKAYNKFSLQIFATDLDAHSIGKAREGVYPASLATEISLERLERFFVKTEHGYRVTADLRKMVIFAQQNLIMDPPFTKLDLLCCRNLLIYLTRELQEKLIPLFHYSLNPGGILFLGNSETVGGFTDMFTKLEGKNHLYRNQEVNVSMHVLDFPTSFTAPYQQKAEKVLKPMENLQTLADSLLLQTYAPAAVLTNETGDILYISGRTGKYLEPAAGKANWNIFAMARDGLRNELHSAFQMVQQEQKTITLKNLRIGTNGGTQIVNITLQPIRGNNVLSGTVMIVFAEVTAQNIVKPSGKPSRVTPKSARLEELENEIHQARLEILTIREEMQSSQEELKSANEELQSTNEELQSTNEELTTSKEEMQSMNEELQTVNHELQTKLDELSHANNDLKNLLDSTNIATLFLDNHLRVRRFTSQTSLITSLIPGDVGRPITDIASAVLYPQLAEDAGEVLRTLVKVEKQIATPEGSWFMVRILPYRTLENMINGVVITFSDITEVKKLEGRDKLFAELEIANQELVFQIAEKEKRTAELVIVNQELAFQNSEKEKRAAELVIANAYLEKLTSELKK
jgi:two-component system CheB/CheR fusion protein